MTLNLIPSDYIGNSLSSINLNFEKLDNFVYQQTLTSQNLFTGLIDFYNAQKSNWDSMVTLFSESSAKWNSLTSLVNTNSSNWINPIVYISATIENNSSITQAKKLEIAQTFKNLYPVTVNNIPAYIENQTAIIYYYTYENQSPINDNFLIQSNYAFCRSEASKFVCKSCQAKAPGYNYCHGYRTPCSSCAKTCYRCGVFNCVYPETGASYVDRYLQAAVNFNFIDRYEKNLNAMIYKVKNCEWVFDRNLT